MNVRLMGNSFLVSVCVLALSGCLNLYSDVRVVTSAGGIKFVERKTTVDGKEKELRYRAGICVLKFKEGEVTRPATGKFGFATEELQFRSANLKAFVENDLQAKKLTKLFRGKNPDHPLLKNYYIVESHQEDLYERCKKVEGIESADLDFEVLLDDGPEIPNDEFFDKMWGLVNTGQSMAVPVHGGETVGTPGFDIDAPEAWEITQGSPGVVVAVIDTGVDLQHPEFQGQLWVNEDEIPGNGIDDDNSGCIDDIHGCKVVHSCYSFGSCSGDVQDDHRHGTHTGGTIAAKGANDIGVIGVAPGVKILPVRAITLAGEATIASISAAVVYAADQNPNITSNSWGTDVYTQVLEDAFQYVHDKGILSVASAGNNGFEILKYPASLATTISVAAVENTGKKTFFTTYGPTVDLAAPGQTVLSTVHLGFSEPDEAVGYQYLSGTSMSAPHVAGVAALVMSKYPELSVRQYEQIIKGSVTTAHLDSDNAYIGTGMINARLALEASPMNVLLEIDRIEADYTNPDGVDVYGSVIGNEMVAYSVQVSHSGPTASLYSDNFTLHRYGAVNQANFLNEKLITIPWDRFRNHGNIVRITLYDSQGRELRAQKAFRLSGFGFTDTQEFSPNIDPIVVPETVEDFVVNGMNLSPTGTPFRVSAIPYYGYWDSSGNGFVPVEALYDPNLIGDEAMTYVDPNGNGTGIVGFGPLVTMNVAQFLDQYTFYPEPGYDYVVRFQFEVYSPEHNQYFAAHPFDIQTELWVKFEHPLPNCYTENCPDHLPEISLFQPDPPSNSYSCPNWQQGLGTMEVCFNHEGQLTVVPELYVRHPITQEMLPAFTGDHTTDPWPCHQCNVLRLDGVGSPRSMGFWAYSGCHTIEWGLNNFFPEINAYIENAGGPVELDVEFKIRDDDGNEASATGTAQWDCSL